MLDFLEITKTKVNNEDLDEENLNVWKSWKWQIENTISSVEEIEDILRKKLELDKKSQISKTMEKFPMAITPYYLSLIDFDNYENDPVFKQVS